MSGLSERLLGVEQQLQNRYGFHEAYLRSRPSRQ